MSAPYTIVNLADVEDLAPAFGMGETHEARFATGALAAERTGVALYRLRPGRRHPFGHRHDEAEEVYVVLAGSGWIKLDDTVVELRPLDAIRIAPAVVRALEAGPAGLEYLAVGARHDADGELIHGWWD